MPEEKRYKLLAFQQRFMDSRKRFPAMVSSIGTGKTMTGIFKMMKLMSEAPNNLGLIVRKEFTDLRDSTMKDFELYTGMQIEKTDKQVTFPNGSVIMFRHGSELNVLKNINLGAIMLEQAEEFETDETFHFCRDRLRRKEAKHRCLFPIANANGHNWMWKLWKNNPQEEYDLHEATSFDNPHLPKDFTEDLKRMEREAPHHYRRYVLNSWEDVDEGDLLLPYQYIEEANKQAFFPEGVILYAIDVARFGPDRTVHCMIQKANKGWKQTFLKSYNGKDTSFTSGEALGFIKRFRPAHVLVDDIKDEPGPTFHRYMGNGTSINSMYQNKRSEDFFRLQKLFLDGEIQLLVNDEQNQDLSVLKFRYKGGGKTKYVVSKDELKKEGIRSPDFADALSMAASLTKQYEVVDYYYNEPWRGQKKKHKYAGYAGGW
jgi:hypothetical protein